MTHKKLILLSAAVALAGMLSLGTLAYAHNGEDHSHGNSGAQRLKVEEKKAAIMEKITATKEARAEKLADKRLQACEKRQVRINAIFTKATVQNKKQLAVFKAIEDKVKAFYTDKNLSVDGYDEVVAKTADAYAKAEAAIEASQATTFDCTSTDAANPGNVIKTAMQARHGALKEYRTTVKDLILVVKKHNGQNRTTTGTDDSSSSGGSDTTETETETETEATGGQQ